MKRAFKRLTTLLLAVVVMLSVSTTPQFSTSVQAQTVGSVNLSGDATIDSDQLSDSTTGQPRWLSYPGTRLCLNANVNGSNLEGAMALNIPIKLGGIIGTTTYRFSNIMGVKVAATGGSGNNASSVNTTWYPHKITFNSTYSSPSASISGYDFFADNLDSIVRVMNVTGSSSKDVILDGTIYGTGAQWLSTDKVLLITHAGYYYAFKFVELDSSDNATDLTVTPTITSSTWSLRIQCGTATKKIAVGFGLSARSAETSADAVQRAKDCFNQSVAQKLQTTKNYYDSLLKLVPAPTTWGINFVATEGVTPAQHKLKYYQAYTFVLSNYVRDLPDDSYPYAQVLCGKPSLYNGGSANSPGTCAWESFFGQQLLAYVMPNEAWSAFEGVMSNIPQDGNLSGECLPSRKAQTAWFLYAKTNDSTKLANVYPAIKRYLIWREANPRWIYEPNNNISDEKDMEFVVSWMRDVDYAIKICDTLGLTADKASWQSKQTTMMNNFRTWFISTSTIYQYYFTSRGTHYYSYRDSDLPPMIITALDMRNLPSDLVTRFKNYYSTYHNALAELCGFNYLKYPGSDLTSFGLLDRGMINEFRQFVDINLREAVQGCPFAERIDLSGSTSVTAGVMPSLFTACTVITSTWQQNNLRVDSGYPELINTNVTPPASYPTITGNTGYEWIQRVVIGTLDNTSGDNSGYKDNTSVVTNMTKGTATNTTLTPGFKSSSYTESWKVWIDFNQDKDFDDADEQVFAGSGSSAVTGTITIPSTALTGNTRMRIAMKYNSAPANSGSLGDGEAEDYTVNIQ